MQLFLFLFELILLVKQTQTRKGSLFVELLNTFFSGEDEILNIWFTTKRIKYFY